MRTWTKPDMPAIQGPGTSPKLFNALNGRLEHPPVTADGATLYVCGITPYDATHIGHAFTYLTFDLLQRAWHDAGVPVIYAQNITDIDDPLLERAQQTGQDPQKLAAEQINLFRSDMHRLHMLPPAHYVAVTETIDTIAYAVSRLLHSGVAYTVPTPESLHGDDIYFDHQKAAGGTWQLGDISHLTPPEFLHYSAERGGDPDRAGKRHPLDPLLWRAARTEEPSWESCVGTGRPGWHIECAVIAQESLGVPFTVQGGGQDLLFPHHEFSAACAAALTNNRLAHVYMHAALVAYRGHKMSKSRGNLVFVSKLLDAGYSGSAIRLALMQHHYRSEFEWQDDYCDNAQKRLERWSAGFTQETLEPLDTREVIAQLRTALANDLDTPVMLAVLDSAAAQGVDRPAELAAAIQSLLGVEVLLANRVS